MIRRFRVTVDGETYEVEVQELDGARQSSGGNPGPLTVQAPAPPPPPRGAGGADPPAPAPRPRTEKPVQPEAASGGAADDNAVVAPLPGTVLSVRVAEGQRVAAGDVVLILEAMKMENEIAAPRDGVVKQINVKQGDAVGDGAVLAVLA